MKKSIIIIIFILISTGCGSFYTNIKEIKNPNNLLVLINKNNRLNENYIPKNLVKLKLEYSHDLKYLRKEAALSFYKLSEAAKKENYKIIAVSGYRSYTYQEKLFNYYVKEKGINYALLCSAKPGHSEHQSGLAVDVEGSNHNYDEFESSKEFYWMKNNSYKFGFILRYPKGKENITGFKYEPWHYRYVGRKAAAYIYKHNLTLEEYLKK